MAYGYQLDSLSGEVHERDLVVSNVLEVPDLTVSGVSHQVDANNPIVQHILIGRERLRYDEGIEGFAFEQGSFVGRDLTADGSDKPDPNPLIINFANAVLHTARNQAPIMFRSTILGVLVEFQYVEAPTEFYNALPHVDWVSEHPTILGIGAVPAEEADDFDPTVFYTGSYMWRGDSREDEDYGKYVGTVGTMNKVLAKPDTMYVGDARVLLHSGPDVILAPRVLARVFAAPLVEFIPPGYFKNEN